MSIDTFKEYQNQVQRTRSFNESELTNYTLGLVCEAGEFGDIIKKHLYHNHELDVEEVVKELGDVMWYLSNICNVLDIQLSDVATGNIDKLKKRYPNGFSSEDSINRSE
ncbi:MAG: nucleoside triphosphate pyrophosphohydrolase family protein [Peptostreptococcaceae bacterium]